MDNARILMPHSSLVKTRKRVSLLFGCYNAGRGIIIIYIFIDRSFCERPQFLEIRGIPFVRCSKFIHSPLHLPEVRVLLDLLRALVTVNKGVPVLPDRVLFILAR